jgi:hypothetical protein
MAGKNLNTELSTALKVSNGTAVSRVVFANNELILISAAWITTEDKIELAKAPQDHSIMIFVDKLTPKNSPRWVKSMPLQICISLRQNPRAVNHIQRVCHGLYPRAKSILNGIIKIQ